MGITFQILVYNAQRATQALIPIIPTLDYNLSGLYLSTSHFSLLFDSQEVMENFTRVLLMTQAFINTHIPLQNTSQATALAPTIPPFLFRKLPSNSTDADTVITSSSTVGLYINIFECGELNEYPDEALKRQAFKSVQEPEPVLKLK